MIPCRVSGFVSVNAIAHLIKLINLITANSTPHHNTGILNIL